MIDKRISRARTRLLLDAPFFGTLAMRLRIEAEPSIDTFDVDGTVIRYNPTFADTLADDELQAVLAHEVLHCAMLHPYRRGTRDGQTWNEACDYAINSELVKSGFKLPADCLLDAKYAGQSAETIYAGLGKRPQPQPQPGNNGNGQGTGQPSTGQVSDAKQPGKDTGQPGNSPASEPMSASDWEIATKQATAVCKMAGTLPGGITETIDKANQCPEDWRTILREFVEHTLPWDYSWTSPNRRFISQGLYLPGTVKENMGRIAVAVDTSASIDSRLLAVFCNELNAIVSEAKPESVTVLYCDTKVNRTETFLPDEAVKMSAEGRGGTRFQPVFDAVGADEPPACLIYFTDLENPASEVLSEPDYPVLWATALSVTALGQFGRTVRISEHV